MKKEKTEIDKSVAKIKKLLSKHSIVGEHLEMDRYNNIYIVGRFKSGTIYEQKCIGTVIKIEKGGTK